ncbi:hypothetical protein [Oxalicibacterium solurbis]|uniref:Uncharacterized protein n=1 Tax=Oxalicibacterium solurbis TaxID=69280 RepID=A0A8J3ATN5_9BURK|nr:hypothetical protein [Oxalicibacterium solurbis]GGI53484.1 hypothetical protein GCM10011430_06580 [Oxalicibacterium solurbis]
MTSTDAGQFRSVMTFLFLIACLMFYFAFDTWYDETLACRSSRSICMLSQMISDLTGIELRKVTAQVWAAFGLTMFFIIFLVFRDRRKKEQRKGVQIQRMK